MAWGLETNIKGPVGPPGPGIVFKGTVANYAALPVGAASGDMYITNDTGHGWAWNGTAWVDMGQMQGSTGPQGPAGPAGPASTVPGPPNSLAIGTVTTVAPGGAATSTITGTAPSQTLNLGIPSGLQGATGATGSTGSAGTPGAAGAAGPPNVLSIGTTTTGAPGSAAASSITGTSPTQTLNLTIPRGDVGATGTAGAPGQGVAAGGTTGQVLSKIDSTNYNTNWTTPVVYATTSYVDTQDALRVAKAGDTMTGDLTISKTAPLFWLNKTGSGTGAYLNFSTGGQLRWSVSSSPVAEATGSVGSDFAIDRYDNVGGLIGNALTITRSSGNVTLSGTITVGGGTVASGMANAVFSTTGAGTVYLRPNGPASATGQATINSSGTLAVAAGVSTTTGIVCNGAGDFALYPNGPTQRILQGASGGQNILWDTTAASWGCYTGGGNRWTVHASDGSFRCYGPVYKPGGGSWLDIASDERVKNVAGPYEIGLAAVRGLNPVLYTFKGNDTNELPANRVIPGEEPTKETPVVPYPNSPHYDVAVAGTVYTGLIAQELELVMPNLVTQRDGYIDGEPVTDLRGIDTSPLIFALINAVKELAARVEALEAAP